MSKLSGLKQPFYYAPRFCESETRIGHKQGWHVYTSCCLGPCLKRLDGWGRLWVEAVFTYAPGSWCWLWLGPQPGLGARTPLVSRPCASGLAASGESDFLPGGSGLQGECSRAQAAALDLLWLSLGCQGHISDSLVGKTWEGQDWPSPSALGRSFLHDQLIVFVMFPPLLNPHPLPQNSFPEPVNPDIGIMTSVLCVSQLVQRRRRQWQPTPVFLPGESQGQGSLVGCRLWGCTRSDTI